MTEDTRVTIKVPIDEIKLLHAKLGWLLGFVAANGATVPDEVQEALDQLHRWGTPFHYA